MRCEVVCVVALGWLLSGCGAATRAAGPPAAAPGPEAAAPAPRPTLEDEVLAALGAAVAAHDADQVPDEVSVVVRGRRWACLSRPLLQLRRGEVSRGTILTVYLRELDEQPVKTIDLDAPPGARPAVGGRR
ncbi:MAG TPA: hypothetical protein VGQ83_24115 [Polyangia bacterium]|jgi:hypothetical protein